MAHDLYKQPNPFGGPKDWSGFVSSSQDVIRYYGQAAANLQQALDLMNAAAPKVAPHGQCEGFYQVIDWIREHHPATVLEACASGGRRVDLETASRFHTFWISDHTIDHDIVRFHLEGMNYFLPGNYGYVCYTLPLPIQKQFQATDFGFQSFFGGAFGISVSVRSGPSRQVWY